MFLAENQTGEKKTLMRGRKVRRGSSAVFVLLAWSWISSPEGWAMPCSQCGQVSAPKTQKFSSQGVVQVDESHPRYSDFSAAFVSLGPVYEVANFYLSAPGPERLSQEAAKEFCEGLGEGVRLPWVSDYWGIAQALGFDSDSGFQPEVIPGFKESWYWTGSSFPAAEEYGFVFSGFLGMPQFTDLNHSLAVRCVLAKDFQKP